MDIDEVSALIVDDNESAARLLTALLNELGVRRAQSVGDGQQALDLLNGDNPDIDIVLCDWRMPNMSGLELLKNARITHPKLPFMMISANADDDSQKAARSEGVNSYLVKPYVPEDLEKKLKLLVLQM